MYTSGNTEMCHRPHCRFIHNEPTIAILPSNLVNYKKCARCQPPVMPESKQKFVSMAIMSSQ